MKIGMADNCALKFSKDIKEHWEKKGHEVRYEIGASEHISQWADLYYIDWWDRNIDYLFQWHRDNPEAHKPKFAVRAIDWDIWCGYVPISQQYVDFVDHIIFIADHMKLEGEKTADLGNKGVVIKPGLDVNKFTFRNRTHGNKIAMITGDIWQMKNVMEGLMFFEMADKNWPERKFEFHWRAQYADHGRYMKVAVEHFIQSRGLEDRFHMYASVSSINDWLEPMDYIIQPSIKEAFSYSIAEGMAKGIKPIINNWYGANKIWSGNNIYNNLFEAIIMLTEGEPYESTSYREFVSEHYSIERMLAEYDQLLGT